MEIQVAIVSDQVLANLIPALMDRPERVVLVCSESMRQREQGKRQKSVLGRHDVSAHVWNRDIPEGPLDAIRRFAWDLAEALQDQHPEAAITLNATGGTKLMMLGMVEAFRNVSKRIIYTNTAQARLEVVHDESSDENPPPMPMADVLDVQQYLAAQGFRLQTTDDQEPSWAAGAEARKPATKFLGRNASKLEELIGVLNALAASVFLPDQRRDSADAMRDAHPVQHFRRSPRGIWRDALQQLCTVGLLRWDGDCEIEFLNREAVRFVNGGWLEEYAWHIVRDAGVADCRAGVRGVWDGAEQARNEFDVMACHRNQLLFIECKTLKFDSGQNDNEIAYKVESLGRDTRGLFGQTWLVTARTPSDVLRDRARQARFEVIGPSELPKLQQRVKQWMGHLQGSCA
ncbi:hypothetical protein TVNIR_1479 [Thioalkalivibrio nitratireducens DSM 14787]|uniref:DUF1887 family protein n=1 Tax=Thioalkalivibrio nitratireducens (strain DSM 14787 / UNIQEM 213 / ALEN2) TaxID=1255043 RepID=L0DU72_THIND|nr:DUF1887 family CARF protein [Thioalkalivibrio nitratireducens]AGA33149.1 hypothetical protein TVNIR_1479 [Thioalkalivibrio nitratireducens DSM 14787]